jgi:hypothetical protein
VEAGGGVEEASARRQDRRRCAPEEPGNEEGQALYARKDRPANGAACDARPASGGRAQVCERHAGERKQARGRRHRKPAAGSALKDSAALLAQTLALALANLVIVAVIYVIAAAAAAAAAGSVIAFTAYANAELFPL